MTATSILFKASLAFTHASSLTRLSLPPQTVLLRGGPGGRNLEDRFRSSHLDTERRPRLFLLTRVAGGFDIGSII